MSILQELNTDQQDVLTEFRNSVRDVLKEDHDDYFLLRWLRARKWNRLEAEKMLRASFKSRLMWNVDNLDKWEPPKVLKDYLPYGMVGFDNEGSPVILVPFYNFDIYGMLHCVTRLDFQRYVIKLLEYFMGLGYEKSKEYGPKARQVVVLFDVADFNLKQYVWRPAAELIINMIKQYEQNYPEILKICYVINTPKIFFVAYNFLKKFLDDYTMSKIIIFPHGCDKWKSSLFQHVSSDIVPQCFGGNYSEDGDGKCPKMITWAGKIPKELFVHSSDNEDHEREFTEATISKGNKLKLDFDVGEIKYPQTQILSWEFRTKNYDIKFGIYSIDKVTGEKRSEIDLGTVYSNEMDEIGFISVRPNTIYTIVFDNSNSYLRSKKLRYWVNLSTEETENSQDVSNGNHKDNDNVYSYKTENNQENLVTDAHC